MLSVSDDGVGIPEHLDIEQTATFGLQLVTMLADQLGGELKIQRANPTRFLAAFPYRKRRGGSVIPAQVLIVEDERVVAMHLRQQLSRLGYRVPAMATAGSQALKQIEEHRPDVVLMDIHIEGDIDGIETAARIPPELRYPSSI